MNKIEQKKMNRIDHILKVCAFLIFALAGIAIILCLHIMGIFYKV